MKLKRAKFNNFCKFTDMEIEFDGKITRLVGMNGSGKSTVINAIWAGIKGIAEGGKNQGKLIGKRYRFIGDKGKTAGIELEFFDEKRQFSFAVSNKITKSSNQINFELKDRPADFTMKFTDEWVNEFFNVYFLSAKHFTELSPVEQALQIGIDTSTYDNDIKALKTEFTLINRDLKNVGNLDPVEKVESVDINALVEERQNRSFFNQSQEERQSAIDIQKDSIEDSEKEIKELGEKIKRHKEVIAKAEEKIKGERENIDKFQKRINELPQPEELKTFDDIDQKLIEAQSINNKAKDYKDYLERVKKADKIKAKIEENKHKQETKKQARIDYIKSKNLPFSDLSIDETGGLMLKERPINTPYFSKGELEIVVAKLYMSIYGSNDDSLKTRFIDNFEMLDEKNQEKLTEALMKDGFQIVTAEVGEKKGENIIILRECKIVNNIKKDEGESIL